MKKKMKMNGLYKTAFILALVCIPMLIAAIIFAYLLKMPVASVLFSGGGAFLAFLGIIFAAVSKPKKEKSAETEDFTVTSDDNFTADNTESMVAENTADGIDEKPIDENFVDNL